MTAYSTDQNLDQLVPRILRDVNDGVLALDRYGHIIYMNPQFQAMLGVGESVLGCTYAEVFLGDVNDKGNDRFHQFIIDAVYQKDKKHQGTVPYIDASGAKKYMRITSSYLKNAEANDRSGIIMVIDDVTEAEMLRKKKRDSSIVFACVTACVCLYLLLLAVLEFFKINVPTKALTQVINAMVFIFSCIIYRKTNFTVDDLGLKIRNKKSTFGLSIAISGGIVALLMLAKFLLLKIAPDFFESGAPFWNWDIGLYSWISYIFTSVLQEFLARSMIYGSIRKMFDGKYATLGSILLSSLLFGAVHIAHGFIYMTAAMILLGALGGLYEKQRNIWGVAIIHFVLGQAAHCLGFFA
jgi:PAS domain S-box-containing protein